MSSSHSILKLEKLLISKNFIPHKYFTIENYVSYIEILCPDSAELFLLYIPSKYEFRSSSQFTYKMKYIDTNTEIENDITSIIENTYNPIILSKKDENIEEKLENKYKKPIKILNSKQTELNYIIKQLNRLRFSVENLKYKISITHKNFMCSIKRDNTIECYTVKKLHSGEQKMYISIDLENFYENIDNIVPHIQNIQTQLFTILENNDNSMISHIQYLLKQTSLSKMTFFNKKKQYDKQITDEYKKLETLNAGEKKILENIQIVNSQSNPNNIYKDMEKSSYMMRLNTELENIRRKKQSIISNLIKLRTLKQNISLVIDNITFNNSVMLTKINDNFDTLRKISS